MTAIRPGLGDANVALNSIKAIIAFYNRKTAKAIRCHYPILLMRKFRPRDIFKLS